jgi:peptidoglycan pentaglycine glycine transferase (the first glycine)
MQIRLIENSTEWNNALLDLSATLYHSWEWGELRATEGWRAWRVLASDSSSPRAAVQVLQRGLPIPGLSILSAPRGIAARPDDRESVLLIGKWLKDFVRQRRAILLRMDPFIPDTDQQQRALHRDAGFVDLPDQWSRWNLPRSNMVVDISGSKEQILAKMTRTHRGNISRSSRSGLEIRAGSENGQFQEFYSLLLKTSRRQNFAIRTFQYYCEVRDKLLRSGNGELFLAYDSGKLVAGILCAYFSKTCHYLYGGFDWDARHAHPNEVLHWHAIQWAKDRGCTEYDLVGSGTRYPPQEGNLGFGIYTFKKGFCAELHYLVGYLDLPGNAVLYRLFRFAESDILRGPLFNAAVKARARFLRAPGPPEKSLKADSA